MGREVSKRNEVLTGRSEGIQDTIRDADGNPVASKWYRPSDAFGVAKLVVIVAGGLFLGYLGIALLLGAGAVTVIYTHAAGPWFRDAVEQRWLGYGVGLGISGGFSWIVTAVFRRIGRSRASNAQLVHGEISPSTEYHYWSRALGSLFIASALLAVFMLSHDGRSYDWAIEAPAGFGLIFYWLAPVVMIIVMFVFSFRLPRFDDGTSEKSGWPTSQRWQQSEHVSYVSDLAWVGGRVRWSTEREAVDNRELRTVQAIIAGLVMLGVVWLLLVG